MDFEYKMEITADPEEVFAALTNPFQIELWSGYPADMKAEEGYVFSLWEGDITGVNLEVVPGKLLVQEWFFGEQEKQSIVRITLKKRGSQDFGRFDSYPYPRRCVRRDHRGMERILSGSDKRNA
ncbi:MAG: SRPBCC domain-containing protein [Odoribacter splanchnicus]